MRKKFLWVLFFHQVEKIFNYFQNHTATMIFQKMFFEVLFWWGTTFWFFKSLDINMVYTLDVYVYI